MAICIRVKQKNNNIYYRWIALAEDEYGVGINVKGLIILAFFSLFAVASLLIPVPMFPGSWFCAVIGQGIREYISVLSAIFNGLFYGAILCLLFMGISRKLAE
ncbi:hypothetical protein JXA31_02170 [Candidatus Bathyarchaeota archaeon]|nr:hypothetical protein [Candidatus Bathyarchaeota archaeon]